MQKIIILIALVFSGQFHTANAQDELSDAEYVVEQLITPELFESVMSALAEVMAGAIELEFRKQGEEVSAPTLAWLGEEMSIQMGAIMANKVGADYVLAYENTLSPEALAGLRHFLETPAGQEYAAKQSVLTREGAAIGEKYGDAIAGEAVAVIIDNIKADIYPDGTTSLVKEELIKLFAE